MSTSVFIARLIGPVMLVIGLAVFANQRAFRELAEEFLASRALTFLSGLIIMPAGLAIVLTHNIWAIDGRVMITVFGWANAIGGAIRLAAPAYVMRTRQRFSEATLRRTGHRRALGRGGIAVLPVWNSALKRT